MVRLKNICFSVLFGVIFFYASFIKTASLVFVNDSDQVVYVKLEDWKSFPWKNVRQLKKGELTAWKPYFKRNIKQKNILYGFSKDKLDKTFKLPQFKGFSVPKGHAATISLKGEGEMRHKMEKEGRALAEITKVALETGQKSKKVIADISNTVMAPYAAFLRNFRNPLNPVVYDIIHDNPFKATKATVRLGGAVASKAEQDCLKKRLEKAKKAQETFLEITFLKGEEPLVIAFVFSGGGARAALCSTGNLVGAKKIGLLGGAAYGSSLSGGTWTLAPWILSKMNIEEFKKRLIEEAKNGLKFRDPVVDIKWCLDNLKTKFAFFQPINLIDLYGSILSTEYLQGLGEWGNPQRAYLSVMADNIKNGDSIIPIFASVTAEIGMGHKWCWFTPWEFGSRWLGKSGAYIPVWAFGRKFKEGISVNRGTEKKPLYGPRPSLGFLMAIWGSAPAATLGQIYEYQLKSMQEGPIRSILKYIMKNTDLEKFRFTPLTGKVFNFMHGLDEFEFSKLRYLQQADAGVKMGNPIFSTYRRPKEKNIKDGSAPDIIFVFDNSAEVGDEELQKQEKYAKKRNLPLPKIAYGQTGKNVMSVFTQKDELSSFKDYEIPTVVYMPRIIDKSLLKEYKDDLRYKDLIQKIMDFDLQGCLKKTCSTFNFLYKAKEDDVNEAAKLAIMTELNLRLNEEKIRKIMLDRVKLNRKRDGIKVPPFGP